MTLLLWLILTTASAGFHIICAPLHMPRVFGQSRKHQGSDEDLQPYGGGIDPDLDYIAMDSNTEPIWQTPRWS